MKIIVLLLLVISGVNLYAQDSSRSDYRVIIQANIGISRSHIERTTIADKAEYSGTGLLRTLRAIWRPDHLLGIGVETGLLRVSSLVVKQDSTLAAGTTIELGAMPLLLVFGMEKYGIELSSGVGIYNYHVDAVLNSTELTSSNQWEIGWMLSMGYYYSLTKTIGIGADFRYYAIPERSVSLTSLSAKFQWQLWY